MSHFAHCFGVWAKKHRKVDRAPYAIYEEDGIALPNDTFVSQTELAELGSCMQAVVVVA